MRVTIQDARVLVGVFMAFDKHMNVVLGDCEEFRRVKAKNAETGKAEERDEKRFLGLVLLRGENVVSLQVEAMPRPAKAAAAPGGPGRAVQAGRGIAVPPMAAAAAAMGGLAGPVRGVGGPGAAAMMAGGGAPRPPVMPPMMPMMPPPMAPMGMPPMPPGMAFAPPPGVFMGGAPRPPMPPPA